jgi:hypothetical protein
MAGFERDKRAEKYHLPFGKKKVYEGEGEYTTPYTVMRNSLGGVDIYTDATILCLTEEETLFLYRNLKKAIGKPKKKDQKK